VAGSKALLPGASLKVSEQSRLVALMLPSAGVQEKSETLGAWRSTVMLAGEPALMLACALPASSATLNPTASVRVETPVAPAAIEEVTVIAQVTVPEPVRVSEPLMLVAVKSGVFRKVENEVLIVPQLSGSLPVSAKLRLALLVGLAVTAARVRVGAVRSIVTVAAAVAIAGAGLPAASVTPSAARVRITVPALQELAVTVKLVPEPAVAKVQPVAVPVLLKSAEVMLAAAIDSLKSRSKTSDDALVSRSSFSRPLSESVWRAKSVIVGVIRSTVMLCGEPELIAVWALPASSATLKVAARVRVELPDAPSAIVEVAGIEQVVVPAPVIAPRGAVRLVSEKSVPASLLIVVQSRFSPAVRRKTRLVLLVGEVVVRPRVRVGAWRPRPRGCRARRRRRRRRR
jgi:hypothetical protein